MINCPFSLDNKTILITGAGGGIGRATAVECAKMGAGIMLTDINEASLNETLALLDTNEGQEHRLFVADLTDEDKQAELVKSLPELDGLVSNAGISKVLPIQFLNTQDMDKIMSINAYAPMYLTQKLFKKKKIKKIKTIKKTK